MTFDSSWRAVLLGILTILTTACSSAQSEGGPTDPVVSDATACAAIKPVSGEYSVKPSSAVPSCFQEHELSGWFDGIAFANRGTAVQFHSDDLCGGDTGTCSIKSSCGLFVNVDSRGIPAHVDFVGVWRDAKHFTGTLSLSVPSLQCSGKVAVTGESLF